MKLSEDICEAAVHGAAGGEEARCADGPARQGPQTLPFQRTAMERAALGAKARRGSHTPGEEGAGRRNNTGKLRCAVGRLRGQGVPDPRPLTPI